MSNNKTPRPTQNANVTFKTLDRSPMALAKKILDAVCPGLVNGTCEHIPVHIFDLRCTPVMFGSTREAETKERMKQLSRNVGGRGKINARRRCFPH